MLVRSLPSVPLTRRRFLFSMGALAGATVVKWPVCARADGMAGLQSATRTSTALGSAVSMTALHQSTELARRAIDAAFAELELVDQVMSIYRPDSQVSVLNRQGYLEQPHLYLLEVLRKAQLTAQQSGGAFDITVQPLWELYVAASKTGQLPQPATIANALARVDWRRLKIADQRVRLEMPGMAITLNGIAQGYAADRALAALRRAGVEHALVNTGELGAVGNNPGGQPWSIGIQHPRQKDAYIALAKLSGRCLATSGDYETSFTQDHAYNHIFDPATGRSPLSFSSVSIVARTGIEADALSTAVFVMGLEKSLKLIQSIDGAAGLFVFKDGRVMTTRGFPIA